MKQTSKARFRPWHCATSYCRVKYKVVSRLRGWRCCTEKWHIGDLPVCTPLLFGNFHGYQQCPDRFSAGVRFSSKQPFGHAHHRRGGAGAFDQRLDSVSAAVDLSNAQSQLRPDVHPGRADHPDVSTDRLAVAALGGLSHRPPSQAVATAGRDRLHLGRDCDDVGGRQLPDDPARGRVDRYRLVDLSPGSVPCGATGLGRALRVGAIDFSGGR
ncbi:hypothetical protein D3C84_631270 [compost metagenome]